MKKLLYVGMAGLVAAQSSHAALDDMLGNTTSDGFSNVTPGAAYEVNGKRVMTTTSVYFRFGPSMSTMEPIFHISPPDVSIGCNGFNLQGLFVSLLGFDRLAKMLKSAGASLAWGIVVGLVYSLPGIFSAFKMLNEWANKIMQLLQNACQSGVAIGKEMGEKMGVTDASSGIKGAVDGWMSSIPPASSVNLAEEGANVVKKIFGVVPPSTSLAGEDTEMPDLETKKAAWSKIFQDGPEISVPVQYFNDVISKLMTNGHDNAAKMLINGDMPAVDINKIFVQQKLILGFAGDNITENNVVIGKKIDMKTFIESNFSSDEQIGAFIQFLKAVLYVNTVQSKNSNVNKHVTSINDLLEDPTLEKTLEEATNMGLYNTVPSNEGDANLGTTFGKLIAHSFIGSDSITTSNAFPSSRSSIIKLPTFGMWKTKKSKNENISYITLGATTSNSSAAGTISGSEFLQQFVQANPTPLIDRVKNYVKLIVDENNTPDHAASVAGIPAVLKVTANAMKIYKQTDINERSALRAPLEYIAFCNIANVYSEAISNTFLIGSTSTNAYLYDDANNLIKSADHSSSLKAFQPGEEFTTGVNKLKEGFNTVVLSHVGAEGYLPAEIKAIDDLKITCDQLIYSANKIFNEQDTLNKRRAGKVVD